MSDSVWYYARGEQEKGPITTVQIKALAGAGKLHRDDFVWKEGMENWVPAGEVSGLFAEKTASDSSSKSELAAKQSQSRPAALPNQSAHRETDHQTRSISRVVFAVGLLLALLSRGCDTLSDRNVARREALSESARWEFKNEWDHKRSEIRIEQERLQGNPSRSNADNKRLKDLTAAAGKLDNDRTKAERAMELGAWLKNDQAATKAAADDRTWGYWRLVTLLLATVLLTLSLLGVAYSSDGPERWVSFALLAVIFYSLYASDSVWQRVFS
jgi:hypothetical protein